MTLNADFFLHIYLKRAELFSHYFFHFLKPNFAQKRNSFIEREREKRLANIESNLEIESNSIDSFKIHVFQFKRAKEKDAHLTLKFNVKSQRAVSKAKIKASPFIFSKSQQRAILTLKFNVKSQRGMATAKIKASPFHFPNPNKGQSIHVGL